MLLVVNPFDMLPVSIVLIVAVSYHTTAVVYLQSN